MRRKKKGKWDQWQQPWSGYREPKTGVGKTQLEKHEDEEYHKTPSVKPDDRKSKNTGETHLGGKAC